MAEIYLSIYASITAAQRRYMWFKKKTIHQILAGL